VTTLAAASPVPREARPYQGRSAGLVSRSVAGVVDGLVVVLLVVVGAVGVNGVRFLMHPRGFDAAPTSLIPVLGVFLIALAFYLAAAWAVVGRTYGCHMMGLRVVDRRSQMPRPLRAIARAALCVLFPAGLLWCVVGSSRRSVQDVLLGTHVIYDWVPRSIEPSPGTGEPVQGSGN
jgi:uncharacterized RDD family membrane protein YckC